MNTKHNIINTKHNKVIQDFKITNIIIFHNKIQLVPKFAHCSYV
jgi:hypothetical protein